MRHYVLPSRVYVEIAAIPLLVLLFSCHVLQQAVVLSLVTETAAEAVA